jgi:Na+-translocating ferredoxin:NAD+ oxidoreductase subunit G
MFKSSVALTVISCVAAVIVAVANDKTKERIACQVVKYQTEALQMVVPAGSKLTEQKFRLSDDEDSVIFWTGSIKNDTVYVFKVENHGYSGMIKFLVGVTAAGKIIGMAVLDQNETPGLGTRIQEVVARQYIGNGRGGNREKTAPWFSEQFRGISVNSPIMIEKEFGEWHSLDEKKRKVLMEKNSITAVTGSTISTRAVISGLTVKVQAYLKAIRG